MGWLLEWSQEMRHSVASWISSLAAHAVLLLLLSLLAPIEAPPGLPGALVASFVDNEPLVREPVLLTADQPSPAALVAQALSPREIARPVAITIAEPWQPKPSAGANAPRRSEPAAAATLPTASTGRMLLGGSIDGRESNKRHYLARAGGGSPLSEEAVERGLRWLVAHQNANGGWLFNHQTESCNGQCRNPGTFASATASTGLGLLPLLGAGSTHELGEHREAVRKGIYYLCDRMAVSAQGGDLRENTMYAQGIATIALCEAYAMTKDRGLKPYAQSAVDFIVHAQDQHGGGWRYTPGQPGDTTVFGWQLMALRSAQLGGLNVPSPAIALAEKFLDSVQSQAGARYGYLSPEKATPTTSSIGLLCRMTTGWKRDRPGLAAGVAYLEKLGPHNTDMYYNYYATQVMHHCGGSPWIRWNKQMRDQLVAAQATAGHENGSWYFPDEHAEVGGRLYSTTMAIMTLEVYYRYMPLYQPRAIGEQ